jgi:hypothetical protein
MSTTLDMTSFAASLKTHYLPLTIKNLTYDDRPFHGMLEKMENFTGANTVLPNIFGNPQGASATFATGQANKVSSSLSKFTIVRYKDYAFANIDNETMEASVGDEGAFMEAATVEIDGAFNTATNRLAADEFKAGTGTIGQIASAGLATNVITLADPESVVFFEVGQTIQASSGDGSGLRTGSAQITGIDRNAGTLTCSTGWATGISAIAASDYLLTAGDFNLKMPGLDGWIPMPGVLTNTAFFGVDRTQDASRLAGVNMDRTGAPIEDALVDLITRQHREGGKPTDVWLNFTNYASLEKALGARVSYINPKSYDAEVSFQGMKFMSPKGPVNVMADRNMFSNRAYSLQMNTWKLYSLGSSPKIIGGDGLKFLRQSSADGVELRVGRYAVLGCTGPGANGVVKLS